MKIKLPISTYNWTSLAGATIALISFFMIVFLFAVSVFLEQGRTYLGLVIYIVLPAVLVIGLLLIPLGMYIKNRRVKMSGTPETKWPLFNLNEIRQRNAFYIFMIGTSIFLFVSAIGSYEAFHFTESNDFCGKICHAVMQPEFAAYQYSPHARVACVECHVGEGADWYVRSKMSGLYQVYAVLADVYPKPIPTPISNLRPARETCEKCHWPEKFYAYKLRHEKHFLPDESNTEWDIFLTMKIGASHSALGLQEGIHWHINPNTKVEYVSTEDTREEIPWIKYTDLATGEEIIYQDENNQLDQEQLDTMIVRTMDCMDCHNRPSHNYKPPAFFVNNGMTAGKIPRDLPEIKSVAMDLCGEDYESMQEAMDAIESGIKEFYADNYPETEESKIIRAISGIQEEFSNNIFPEMKVRWDAYPNHIGHVEFNGCFRCHDGYHKSENDEAITNDCNSCHFITAQGTPDNMERAVGNAGLDFKHPEDIDEVWKESLCIDCHTGLAP